MADWIDRKKPKQLTEIPRSEWTPEALALPVAKQPSTVWLSRKYLVQAHPFEHADYGSMTRLSINSIKRNRKGWHDGLTWDELQAIKAEVGYGDTYAIEVYPRQRHLVNVANIRHLWLFHDTHPLVGWFGRGDEDTE